MGNKKQSESRKRDNKVFLDSKRSKAGVSTKPAALQHSDSGSGRGKVKWGGIKIEEKRIYTLAYADDIVLLAEDEDEMRSTSGRL